MATDNPQNDGLPLEPGAGNAPAPDTIEARIALWQEIGEGDAAVRREIRKRITAQERWLAHFCGKQIARDVIDAHASIEESIRNTFNATRPLGPWLRTVLVNRCIDLYRSNKKGPPEVQPEKAPREEHLEATLEEQAFQQYFKEIREEDATLGSETLIELIDEIGSVISTRLKRPYRRLIFSGASGLARFLRRELLVRWCHDSGREEMIAEGIERIAKEKPQGRLVKLAILLGSKENTVRQNFKRAREEFKENGGHPQIDRLVTLLKRQRS